MSFFQTLDATLKSLERSYPSGVPRCLLEEARQKRSPRAAKLPLFALIVDEEEDPLSGPSGTLVKNLVEKGLKVTLAEVLLCAASESGLRVLSGGSQGELEKIDRVLCFGSKSETRAKSLGAASRTVLFLPSLKEIAEDSNIKKKVWQEIRPLL